MKCTSCGKYLLHKSNFLETWFVARVFCRIVSTATLHSSCTTLGQVEREAEEAVGKDKEN